MEKQNLGQAVRNDEALAEVTESQRQSWVTPAIIFGGLEFTIPVLMVGATLAGSFGMIQILGLLAVALMVQWVGNSIQGYMGAKSGRSSSVIARSGFGATQARWIIGLTIFLISMGWWAVQTAVAANAISVMIGIDYEKQWVAWAVITVITGLLFALPSIIGYSTMKWTDYLAVPAGLVLIISGIIFALQNTGWEKIVTWSPEPKMTWLAAISLIIGVNVSQWVIASDYTRYSRPKIKDQLLIPIGIVGVGLPLFWVGAMMSVGVGDADIVKVMQQLGFSFWGFLILWLATWTSQLVNNYSMGLALSNLFNVNSGKGRAWLTFGGTIAAILVALAGFLNYFMDFLYMTALVYPAIAGVMFVDFFWLRRQDWVDLKGWNGVASLALILGTIVGYYTQYVKPFGIPSVLSLLVTGLAYYCGMRLKARLQPDAFTPRHWIHPEKSRDHVSAG
ncbi:cytosine permease [Melghirimyces profundicolus]|uniref:Cytosine permease n=1 Tax=Melghirimyces profundicolus TaxID=1242148 RepID=A0A2T6C0L7_9BACL|nr:cytosine permease [Melghirimyces profundicolus]PTX61851.1 cytosine permease [Melghirimyces profundicolus]